MWLGECYSMLSFLLSTRTSYRVILVFQVESK
nr:MAG TPA: hypothetical protein [Caudoviricetes sp.]